MFAEDGEFMEFTKNVLLDGPVEIWLSDIETAMRLTLRVEFKPCRNDLKKMLSKRDKWLLANCGQLCNACSQVSRVRCFERKKLVISKFETDTMDNRLYKSLGTL